MSGQSWHDNAAKMAKILQIIVVSMCSGVAALLFGVSLHFPTPSRIIHWVERELETLQQERHDNVDYEHRR
jgi:hypothetical protein